jgi:transcriptional regulator with XRE-family HTH domain
MNQKFSNVFLNLRAIRGDRSQDEFAQLLGLSQSTYHRYESGRSIKLNALAEITEALGVTMEELLTPISRDRAKAIYENAVSGSRKKTPVELVKDARAVVEASAELVTAKNIKAIKSAFGIEEMDDKELTDLYEYFFLVENSAPVRFVKFYRLIRSAITDQKSIYWKNKG